MNIEIDTHAHTLVSGHAYNTIREMAQMAAEKGLKGSCSYRACIRQCREARICIIFRICGKFQGNVWRKTPSWNRA